MEEPMSEIRTNPANEKSYKTDDLTDEAIMPGPDIASNTLELGDPPLLQRPVQTSKSGIEQIIECFRTGTAQLKHILLKEVDIIFECKLCRSLFRGLPNLIKHKEIYCLSRESEPDGSSRDGKKSIKGVLDAIYSRSDKQDYFLRLKPIAGNKNAVFQYRSTDEDIPPSSQSPEYNSTDDCSHVHETNTDNRNENEDQCVEEQERASLNKDEDTDESVEPQVSSEDRTEEADVSDSPSCRCHLCNRTYKVRGRLQSHLCIVHKITKSDSKKAKVLESPDADTSNPQKSPREENKIPWKPAYSVLLDLKTHFCKLCRRTFSSEQNLAKHIELHTDNGTDFFVKFYCCPLCSYRTRRKRDVMRHLSDFHKKNSAYLSRISQSLDSSAIKTPAEEVLNKTEPKVRQQQEVKLHSSPYFTRKNQNAPRRREKANPGVKVKREGGKGIVMKPLSVCDLCGQGFRKQRHLDLHMRSHQKARGGRPAIGVRTRSRDML